MPGRRLSFGPFEVDEGAQVVLRAGEPLTIGQRGVPLLAALLRRPGEILTKSELIDAVWGEAAIEESNLSVQVAALRKALGPTPEGGEWIATIPRVGYRFIGAAGPPSSVSAAESGPSIAVLPFENLSSDPEQGYFADGLAEEIITALSKLPGVLVIARNSSFAYRGANIDIRKVGEELDVRYVLSGSVRRSGDRLRMSARLAEVASGAQRWAESYDRQLADIFAIQDDVTRQIVAVLRLKLTGSPNVAPGEAVGTKDMEALDLLMRGRGLLSSLDIDRDINAQGIALLEEALRRDPGYVDPHVTLVIGRVTEYSNRWTAAPAETLRLARRVADHGVKLAPEDGEIRAASSLVAMLEKDHERLGEESEIAMSLSPLGSFANLMYGGYLVNDGRPLRAIPHYEQAIRANPGLTHLYIHHLGTAYLFAERYETAAALFRSRIVLSPRTDMSRAYLCVALGHLGAHAEAHQVWAELVEINPAYSLSDRLSTWHYRDPSFPDRLLSGLRKAGLPG